jgi:hypothetical protein
MSAQSLVAVIASDHRNVWHTPLCGGCWVYGRLWTAVRFARCSVLTWLANCARRILRQLMVAIAKEWRGER